VVYPYALGFICFFGLPLFLVARRYGVLNWWVAACGGILGGCTVELILALPSAFHFENFLVLAIEGLASSLLFFAVWRHSVRA
jgi:hypothetical protein